MYSFWLKPAGEHHLSQELSNGRQGEDRDEGEHGWQGGEGDRDEVWQEGGGDQGEVWQDSQGLEGEATGGSGEDRWLNQFLGNDLNYFAHSVNKFKFLGEPDYLFHRYGPRLCCRHQDYCVGTCWGQDD